MNSPYNLISVYRLIQTIVLVSIFSGLESCKNNNMVMNNDITPIIISDYKKGKININELVDSIAYIPLQTSENILLSNIICAKQDKDKYFVQDSKGLYIFDGNGKYICEIGHRGQGPDEYYNLDCFYIDRKQKHVCIVSNVQRKIFRYMFNGELHSVLSMEKDDANIFSVMPLKDDNSFLAHYALANKTKSTDREYALMSLDNDRFITDKLMDSPKIHSGEAIHQLIYYPMAYFKNSVFLLSAFSNILYIYDDNKVVGRYSVNIPGIAPEKDFLEKNRDMELFKLIEKMNEQKIGMGITAIESTEYYLFLSINNKETLIWDGNRAILVEGIYNPQLNCYSNLMLSGGVSDEHLGVLQAEFILNNKDCIVKGNNDDLAYIAEQISEDDNPILFRFYFKKNLLSY